MGDNAEFEKLSTLEARLADALDRIAVGVGEAVARAPIEDPGMTSGAFEDAQIRAEAAEARAAALEARVAELEAAGGVGAVRDLSEIEAERDAALQRVQALEAARQADRDEAERTLGARDARIAALEAGLSEAQAAPADSAEADRLRGVVGELEARVARLRAERAEAIAERDEARDIAEELQAASGMDPEERAMALRAEIKELRVINARLTKNLARLRGEKASDPTVLNKALVVELDALRAARASEAAELERILADLGQPGAGEGGHA
ncbi:hypothetical protein [Roseicyclus persicicus]|uniref:Colicin transporter n=1 Tax=Roseicyclus persicicus TaxID=2650661 RepID=A0A7X6H2Y0_9RHOB|nr:hypothetical protein [Roseibacterium persicicum]NKX45896.1 hypothetical protein [Roseibacterium persicicum]